ncbi:hypothetical protein C7212DRAFT_177312, partial [Tuber magnatum]
PALFFQLFIMDAKFELMVINTNLYAISKEARESGHYWWNTSVGELMIFVGLLIYMGVHKAIRVGLYWKRSDKFPYYEITQSMLQF